MEEEEEIDIDQLLETKFQEGVQEGIRQSNLESQQREALAERLFEAIQTQMDALPRIWPVVTDLSLDIARTVCLQSLSINEQAFRAYLNTALENIEFPEGVPVESRSPLRWQQCCPRSSSLKCWLTDPFL